MTLSLRSFLGHYAMFGFLGWTAENLANLANPHFLSCNGLARQLSTDTCWFPFPFAHGFGGLVWLAFWKNGGAQQPLLSRMLFYAVAFNVIEYVGGVFAQRVVCPRIDSCQYKTRMWHYNGLGSIQGHIDLPHTLAWVALGLVAERLYPIVAQRSLRELVSSALFVWLIIHLYKSATRRQQRC